MKLLKSLMLFSFLLLGTAVSDRVSAQDQIAFSQADLDQMLAPIALYPDTVLSHVLIAATYPLEIVEATRWSRSQPNLRGEQAVAYVEPMNWDASVKALVAFPELLGRLNDDLRWTQNLGDAFLIQEAAVMDTVQYLRNQAYDQGNLASNDYQRVVRETRYIYIEPVRPRLVYVPYYDPRTIYGPWRYVSHPPIYWGRPAGFSLNIGFHWGSGFSIAPSFYFSAFNWSQRQVVVVNNYHNYYFEQPHRVFHPGHGSGHGRGHARGHGAQAYAPKRWKHNPQHRRGVDYRRGVDQQRFTQPARTVKGPGAKQRTRPVSQPFADNRTHPVRKPKATGDYLTGRTPGKKSKTVAQRTPADRSRTQPARSSKAVRSYESKRQPAAREQNKYANRAPEQRSRTQPARSPKAVRSYESKRQPAAREQNKYANRAPVSRSKTQPAPRSRVEPTRRSQPVTQRAAPKPRVTREKSAPSRSRSGSAPSRSAKPSVAYGQKKASKPSSKRSPGTQRQRKSR